MKNKNCCFTIKNTLIGVTTGFVNGIFGSGGGTLLVPILNNLLHVEERKSHATALAIIVFLTSASSVVYISNGTYDLELTYKVALLVVFSVLKFYAKLLGVFYVFLLGL